MNSPLNVHALGQVFTPPAIVDRMLTLRQRRGRSLDPSAGLAPPGAQVMDFFALSPDEKFDTITQRALQNCVLPDEFERLVRKEWAA